MSYIPIHVTALLDALKFRNGQLEGVRRLEDFEWAQLLSFCDDMHLTLALDRIPELPGWVRSRVDQNLSDNKKRFECIKTHYTEISAALQAAGAEHLVLKGFAQWPGLMDPASRMQGDIDIYCPANSLFAARDALRAIGYEPLRGFEDSPSDHLPTMKRATTWQWRGNYFDPEMPLSVDVHFRFWDDTAMHFGPATLDQFWQRRAMQQAGGLAFPALDLVDSLGYASLHALRHLLHSSMNMNNAYELAWFLHTNATNEPFWSRWQELHDESLRRLQAVCFGLAAKWFDCSVPEQVASEIARLPGAIERWFREFGQSPLATHFHPNKDALWLHLSLIESSHDSRSVFLGSLFPGQLPPVEMVEAQKHGSKNKQDNRLHTATRYVRHVTSRAMHHARILPRVLWNGVGWWWSSKEMGTGFLTFLAASFLYVLGMYIFFFLFNLYLLDCGFKENVLGLTMGSLAMGGIAGTLPAGMITQRFGLRKTLLLCFSVVPLVCALRALFISEGAQLVLAFLCGAAASIWAVVVAPAMAQLTTEKNRPFGFSLFFAFGIGIGTVGSLAGGGLPVLLARMQPLATPAHVKQTALLIACGIIALAAWPASRLRLTSVPAPERKFYPRSPFLLRFLPAIAVWSLATGAFTPFANAYFSQFLRMPVAKIGMVFSGAQLAQVAAILIAPLIFRKFGITTGIVGMQLAAAVVLGCLALGPAAPAAALTYAGYTAFQWMSEPGMYSLLMNKVSATERSGASALNTLVISCSQAVSAVAAGAAFTRFGYPAVLAFVAGLAVLAAFVFRVLLRDPAGRRPTSQAPFTGLAATTETLDPLSS